MRGIQPQVCRIRTFISGRSGTHSRFSQLSFRLMRSWQMFEGPSKQIVGLERLMLESSGFDFRSHNPQKLLMKIAKEYGADRDTVGRTAYNMSIDLHRTFAPLKQTTATMAFITSRLQISRPGKASKSGEPPVPKLWVRNYLHLHSCISHSLPT